MWVKKDLFFEKILEIGLYFFAEWCYTTFDYV